MYYKNLLGAGAFAVAALSVIQTAHAEFALNWAPSTTTLVGGTANPYANCNRAGEISLQCTLGSRPDPDKTPFIQERIVGTDGQVYYHTIVGQPTDKFGQEVYIRAGGSSWPGGVGTSSMGANFQSGQSPLDPDEKGISGNATANPKRVQFVQANNDGELSMEVRKDVLNNKPLIQQTVNAGDVKVEFSVDMRALSLDDITKGIDPTKMVNKVTVLDPTIPSGAGNFDITKDSQRSNINAGKYRWVPCTAPSGCGPDQSGGTWEYADGGFDPLQVNWKSFRSASENPVAALKGQ